MLRRTKLEEGWPERIAHRIVEYDAELRARGEKLVSPIGFAVDLRKELESERDVAAERVAAVRHDYAPPPDAVIDKPAPPGKERCRPPAPRRRPDAGKPASPTTATGRAAMAKWLNAAPFDLQSEAGPEHRRDVG